MRGTILEVTVPDRLKLARLKAGLDQADLAERIGVSRNNVADYESNGYTRKRKPHTIRRWAWACGYLPSSIDPTLGDDPDGGGSVMPESSSACTRRNTVVSLFDRHADLDNISKAA